MRSLWAAYKATAEAMTEYIATVEDEETAFFVSNAGMDTTRALEWATFEAPAVPTAVVEHNFISYTDLLNAAM
jgi:hypothetical protein